MLSRTACGESSLICANRAKKLIRKFRILNLRFDGNEKVSVAAAPDRVAESRSPNRRDGGRRVDRESVPAVPAARIEPPAQAAAEPDVGQEALAEVL